jgi:hypothetical protein
VPILLGQRDNRLKCAQLGSQRAISRAAQQLFGSPALGYIERLYRKGNKLLADIGSIPRKFYELIKAGSYRRVSAEVYWNYKDEKTGRLFPKVLKAVAFLGAEIPAVTNLDAVTGLYDTRQH